MELPDYVRCLGVRFLSQSGEDKLRAEVAHYKRALEAIAFSDNDDSGALVARQALVNADNSNLTAG